MSKTFCLVTTAALLASVTAFGQAGSSGANMPAATPPAASAPADTSSTPAASTDAGSSTPAPDDAAPAGKMKPHHRGHGMRSAKAGSAKTDEDADKLNACMPDATPTSAQMKCLSQAAQPS
jgi:hypothetical protein